MKLFIPRKVLLKIKGWEIWPYFRRTLEKLWEIFLVVNWDGIKGYHKNKTKNCGIRKCFENDMASLIRALSWPLISTSPLEANEKNCNGNHNNLANGKNGAKHIAPTFQQLIAARRLICRRYYPEGGFGWVILLAAVLVNVLTHGLQLSAWSFLLPAGHRFKVTEVEVDCLGEWKLKQRRVDEDL